MSKRSRNSSLEIWPLLLFLAGVLFLVSLVGPAIDQELAFADARIEAHKASLVSK